MRKECFNRILGFKTSQWQAWIKWFLEQVDADFMCRMSEYANAVQVNPVWLGNGRCRQVVFHCHYLVGVRTHFSARASKLWQGEGQLAGLQLTQIVSLPLCASLWPIENFKANWPFKGMRRVNYVVRNLSTTCMCQVRYVCCIVALCGPHAHR